jgi:hypothetical protein
VYLLLALAKRNGNKNSTTIQRTTETKVTKIVNWE